MIRQYRLARPLFFFPLFIFSAQFSFAAQGFLLKHFEENQQKRESVTLYELPEDGEKFTQCKVDRFGIIFKCRIGWMVEEEEDLMLIFLKDDPITILTIRTINENVKVLGQISNSYLKEKKWYIDGFRNEYSQFAGRQAIEVKGFPADNPDSRALDYYYVRDAQLYGVFFSVYPKERWDEVKFFIRDIAKSFQHI